MANRMRTLAPSVVIFGIMMHSAWAQSSDLGALTRAQAGRSHRVSSAAPTPGSNRDNMWIEPGKTVTLAEIAGPATITHIWLTFADAAPGWLAKDGSANPSELVLRMYWDGAAEPAVESPLGDFFAAGFGLRREINSMPVQVETGDGYNCFWHMPFHTSAKITLTNESDKTLAGFYYYVDYVDSPNLPAETAYFCAQYRQEFPAQPGRDYLVLDAVGHGHYVGTVMSMRSRSPQWFGEGDDKFYIDGDPPHKPGLWGTGTEDYFLSAWGMNECSFPYFGCTFMDGADGPGELLGARYTMYRWHVADPIRFNTSLRFEIEHKGWISADETESGKVEGHVEREDDFATVAFWYQVGQPKRFTTLPSAKQREFPNLDTIIEGRTLLATARNTPGDVRLQVGFPWTGQGQVFFQPADGANAFFEFEFVVAPDAKPRAPVLRLTHSYDYGQWRVVLDGQPIGKVIDLYSASIEVRDHVLGITPLSPGTHTMRLERVGRHSESRGDFLGVDSIRLRERWAKKRAALK